MAKFIFLALGALPLLLVVAVLIVFQYLIINFLWKREADGEE